MGTLLLGLLPPYQILSATPMEFSANKRTQKIQLSGMTDLKMISRKIQNFSLLSSLSFYSETTKWNRLKKCFFQDCRK